MRLVTMGSTRLWMRVTAVCVVAACGGDAVVPQPGAVPQPSAEHEAPGEAEEAPATEEAPRPDVVVEVGLDLEDRETGPLTSFFVQVTEGDGEPQRTAFGPYEGICGYRTHYEGALVLLECWSPFAGQHDLKVLHEGDALRVYERAGDAAFGESSHAFDLPADKTVGFL